MSRPSGSGSATRNGAGKKITRGEWAFVLAGVGLIFAAHYFYGALVTDVTMVIVIGFCLLLAAALATPSLRQSLIATKGLAAPAALFACVVVVGLLSLTPYLPGGAHPVWSFVGVGAPAVTVDKSSTTVEVIKLVALACVFAVGLVTGGGTRRARAALTTLIAAGAAFGLWAFFGSVTSAIPQTQHGRLEAHFLNPNTAGTLFGVLLVIGLAVLLERHRRAAPGHVATAVAPVASASLLFLVCLLMSGSRGAALATLTALAFLGIGQFLVGGGRLTRGAAIGFGIAAVGMAAIYFAGDLIADRFVRTNEDAILRTSIWAEHWKAFQAAPLSGYGLGTSETVNKTLIGLSNFDALWNIRAILNVYLQWLEQAGVIGAALMFGTIALLIVTTVLGLLRGTRAQTALLGLLAVDIVFIVHGATDFGLETPSMAMFWAYLLGLQLTLSQRRQVS